MTDIIEYTPEPAVILVYAVYDTHDAKTRRSETIKKFAMVYVAPLPLLFVGKQLQATWKK